MKGSTKMSPLEDQQIQNLLHRLGADTNYTGFFQTAYAVHLALEDPYRLRLVTKWLYPDVAVHYHTNWKAVEYNIRKTITIIWDVSPGLLTSIARHPLNKKPRPAQFLSILTAHLSTDAPDSNH